MNFNRTTFWITYRAKFVGRNQALLQQTVTAIENLLACFEQDSTWQSVRTIAYAFATMKIETDSKFRPITEYGEDSYFDKYDTRADLGNTPARDGDGLKYKGRGFVQITGKANYEKFSRILNIDLVSKPDLALDYRVAFRIMTIGMHRGVFTGKKLSDYIDADSTDYFSARRIINKLDRAREIADIAKKFEAVLRVSLIDETVDEVTPDTVGDVIDAQRIDSAPEDSQTSASSSQNNPPVDLPPIAGTGTQPDAPSVPAPNISADNQPVGDAPDARARWFLKVEDLKPWVLSKLGFIWKWYGRINFAQFPTLTGGGLLSGGRYWWVGLAVAVLIFLGVTFVAVAGSVVLGVILWKNRREQVHYRSIVAESRKDPRAFNLDLEIVKKF